MANVVADSSRYDVFQLIETALAGDAGRCRRLVQALRAEGAQVPGLVPMLAKELLQVATLARVESEGGNLAGAMRDARIWDSKQAIYRRAITRHPTGRW